MKEVTLKAPKTYYREFIWDFLDKVIKDKEEANPENMNPDELLELFIEKIYKVGWKIVKPKEVKRADKKV